MIDNPLNFEEKNIEYREREWNENLFICENWG